MKNKKILIIIFLIFITIINFQETEGKSVSWLPLVPCGGQGQNPCQFCHFFVMLKNIMDFLLFELVPSLALLFLVFAGFLYVLSIMEFWKFGINTLSDARQIFKGVVLALLIIYSAWLLVSTFFTIIGVEEWTGLKEGWFKLKINCP